MHNINNNNCRPEWGRIPVETLAIKLTITKYFNQFQGMGYLHAKGIVHKDLKSKNIFLENGKVVIADFGLFSVTKLCFGNRYVYRNCKASPNLTVLLFSKGDSLGIPPGWLCYLAPEIVRCLRAYQSHEEELPFTKDSDVYAFG